MHERLPSLSRLFLLTAFTAAFACAASAGDAPRSGSDLATYQGADRQERLVAAAKKEGELTVYHVYPSLPTLLDAFSKKYGIKTKPWRSGSEAVLQRITTEARGNRFDVDVVQNNAPENEAAHRERLLQEVRSPNERDLMPQATPAHHEWTGITLDVFVAAYNTDKLKKEDLPKSYQDLLDPKWKGKLGVEAEDQHWFATLAAAMGDKQTYKLFSDIIATNGISVRKGHSLLANLVASGEVPLGLTVYSWIPEQLKQKGAPIDVLPLPPVVAQFSTIAVARRAPHPNAALLFHDFITSAEGQQLLANMKFVPTSTKIDAPMAKLPLRFIDPGQAIDMQDRWTKTYEEVVTKAAK